MWSGFGIAMPLPPTWMSLIHDKAVSYTQSSLFATLRGEIPLKRRYRILSALFAIAIILFALNSSWLAGPSPQAQTRLLAHRGVHQPYAGDERTGDACHAIEIAPPTHPFIENSLPSMQAAVKFGAEVIELDIHLTPDDTFAVFHDWTLDCKTDGHGVTEQTPFDVLSQLDIGYGYTADDGATYPLRGTGIGLMPSLTEVLEANLGVRFLINFKSRRPDEGRALAELLADPAFADQVFGVYGGSEPTRATLADIPGLRGYDKASLMACLKPYALMGWSGHVPAPCRDTIIAIPISHARLLWGWPHRLTRRMAAHGTTVILLGDYDGSGFSSGIDTPQDWDRVPVGFDGYVWTNRIEVIGPLAQSAP